MSDQIKEKQLSEEELKDVSGGVALDFELSQENRCALARLKENKPDGNAQDQEKAIHNRLGSL